MAGKMDNCVDRSCVPTTCAFVHSVTQQLIERLLQGGYWLEAGDTKMNWMQALPLGNQGMVHEPALQGDSPTGLGRGLPGRGGH